MALTELELRDDVAECMDDCFEATQAAERCTEACIEIGGTGMARCIQLCREAADLATLHARMIARDSVHQAEMAAICADACRTASDACREVEDEPFQLAANVLHRCAESCRQVAGAESRSGRGPGQAAH